MSTVVILVVYLLSTIKMYIYFKNSYSKGGQWSNLDAEPVCLVFTFVPFVNTVFTILELFNNGKKGSKNFWNTDVNSFFKVTK